MRDSEGARHVMGVNIVQAALCKQRIGVLVFPSPLLQVNLGGASLKLAFLCSTLLEIADAEILIIVRASLPA